MKVSTAWFIQQHDTKLCRT